MARDLAELPGGSNERCHLVAKGFPEMVFNLRRRAVLRSSKTTLPLAINFDSSEAEELKLTPQSFHLHCPPAHVDRTEKSKKPRHARFPA